MFSNDVMKKQQTWNDILAVMVKVREQHGSEGGGQGAESEDA